MANLSVMSNEQNMVYLEHLALDKSDILIAYIIAKTVVLWYFSLMQMHQFVCKCNEYLRYFYSLLKWDSTLPSLR